MVTAHFIPAIYIEPGKEEEWSQVDDGSAILLQFNGPGQNRLHWQISKEEAETLLKVLPKLLANAKKLGMKVV
mgnify:FL=1